MTLSCLKESERKLTPKGLAAVAFGDNLHIFLQCTQYFQSIVGLLDK